MAKRSKSSSRRGRKKQEAAVSLLVLGAAFVLVPLVLGASPFAKAFGALMPLGLLMLAAGGLLMWLMQDRADDATDRGQRQPRSSAPVAVTRRTNLARQPGQSITSTDTDRVSGELERKAAMPPSAERAARDKPTSWNAAVFDLIEWRRFEAVVETLFQQAGFETKSQSHGADGGIDVWLYSRHEPGVAVSLVQCKHWQGKRVGVDKVRELRGVMAAHQVRRGQFATTSSFTADAESFARDNSINLLDTRRLLALISQRTPEQQQALLEVALEGDYGRPTCVNCGVKMVERARRGGGAAFWGCIHFPRCKTTLPMRSA